MKPAAGQVPMKAMVLTADSALALKDVARPDVPEGEALVRVSHSGICGTDLKIYAGGIPVRHPLIMGHEMIGELVEGHGADGARTGDRVIVNTVTSCGACFHCRAGQDHICPNGQMIGRDRDGGFAEYATAPSANIFPLHPAIGDVEAPLIQVLTTCVHAHRKVDIFPGEVVAVTGLGVTGQLHVQLARARGATVIGVSRSPWKRDMARALGADMVVNAGEEARRAIAGATGGRGADVVIETAGVVPVLAEAIGLARIGARMMLFGIYTAREAVLPFYQFYFKELAMINVRAARGEDYPASIAMVARGEVDLKPLISHTLPLDGMQRALDMLTGDEDGRMKIILEH